MYIIIYRLKGILLISFLLSCKGNISPNLKMIGLLESVAKSVHVKKNSFSPESRLAYFDSLLQHSTNRRDSSSASYFIASTSLQLGDETHAIEVLEDLLI